MDSLATLTRRAFALVLCISNIAIWVLKTSHIFIRYLGPEFQNVSVDIGPLKTRGKKCAFDLVGGKSEITD